MGVSLRVRVSTGEGAEVRKIESPGAAAKLGFQVGDRVLQINGLPISNNDALQQTIRALHGGEKARFTVLRQGKTVELAGVLDPMPKENLPGAQVILGSVSTKAGLLRTIITRPDNKTGKLPVIFLVGWLSCDSTEYPRGPDDGFGQLLHDIATQSGMVLFRVDKPGTGDSEGSACSNLDLNTELSGYRDALSALGHYDFIDPDRVFVLGMSNGGGFAPLVTQDTKVKGFIIVGGWVKTWFEHMIELERRRVQLSGKKTEEIAAAMRGYSEFYDDYLIKKKTPGEVVHDKPYLASLWYDEPDRQYGRPASFFHQLEELDLLSAWSKVESPVLALHGEFDWIMSRGDDELIAARVNAKHPGFASAIELPKTNHLLYTFEGPQKAFDNVNGRYTTLTTTLVLDFLRAHQ